MIESLRGILTRCMAKDDEAVAELVRRFRPWALDFVTALLEQTALAEDVVQEGFVAALTKLPNLRDLDAFPGWFRQILRTLVSRANRRKKEIQWNDKIQYPSYALTPREQLDKDDLRKRLLGILQSLPATTRETAELFYIREMKNVEISQYLKTPLGTVKRRLHDARRTLRARLMERLDGSVSR